MCCGWCGKPPSSNRASRESRSSRRGSWTWWSETSDSIRREAAAAATPAAAGARSRRALLPGAQPSRARLCRARALSTGRLSPKAGRVACRALGRQFDGAYHSPRNLDDVSIGARFECRRRPLQQRWIGTPGGYIRCALARTKAGRGEGLQCHGSRATCTSAVQRASSQRCNRRIGSQSALRGRRRHHQCSQHRLKDHGQLVTTAQPQPRRW